MEDSMRALRRIAAVAVILVAGWFIYRVSYLRYVCHATEVRIQQATGDLIGQPQSALTRITARQQVEEIRTCVDRFPWIVNLYMIEAANLRLLGREAEAISAYETALRYDRRPEIYLNLGRAEANAGKSGAIRHLAIAGLTSAFATASLIPLHLQNEVSVIMHPLHQSILDGTISDEELQSLVDTLSNPPDRGEGER
jgi:tetratricopeptide (TPR) repeat protein